jgi:4-hydroxymandelate oxidase
VLPTDPIELEAAARSRITEAAYAFYSYGCGAEQSLEDNVLAWRRWHIRPRLLRGHETLSTKTSVLGTEIDLPVLLAPCGRNRMAHPDGELAVARAAAAAGTIQVLSNSTSTTVAEVVAETDAPKWFQLYCEATTAGTDDRIKQAIDAGFEALAITVDAPVLGLRYKGLHDVAAFLADVEVLQKQAGFTFAPFHETPALDWREIERITTTFDVPILLKGILHPDDARLAVEAGAAGVIVSNHGARQLDGTIPPALALPDIVEAVGDRLEIYVDGGVRNGVDVLRALALGARAVLIGRPYLWALAIDGENGVRELLARFKTEIRNAMALAGQADATNVDRDIVVAAP